MPWVYAIENKDANKDYQKFVGVGDQKCEIVEITISIFFLLEICVHYFSYSEFSLPHEKNLPPPKKPIATQNSNLT